MLIDTQAEISVIKFESLNPNCIINESESIKIRGVTDGFIRSLGTIQIDLFFGDFSVPHEFHVVPREFDVPSDGIIGKDFLKYHECDISFRKRSQCFVKGFQ